MRVLLAHQPIDGGVARHLVDLYDGLTSHGHEAILCGPKLPSPSLQADGVPLEAPHVALAMERAVAPRADLRALTQFAAAVRKIRPDVIHAHSSKAGAIARLARVLNLGVPVLYTPHGYAFAGFFEHEIERRAYRQAERTLAPLTSGVIAVCRAEAALARTVTPAHRVRVVHNGIDPPADGAVDPRMRELRERGPVVCTVTQLRPGKGLETLIDALPAVLAVQPAAQVAVIGDGPSREGLIERATRAGVIGAIRFLGEQADPRALIRGADIFLLTSWAEAFPYVILEAMGAGLPVLSSRVGGIEEAIEHGRSGLLVAPADPSATAASLVGLLGDLELRRRLGAAARDRVLQRFTREAMVAGVASVYAEFARRG